MSSFPSFRRSRFSPRAAMLLACAAAPVLPWLPTGAAFAARSVAAKRPAARRPVAELRVDIRADRLTVTAESVPLAQVLARVTLLGGLEVKGPVPTFAVSGQYGPGSPETVLADLLRTAHCSYVMSGHARDGLPRAVVLLPANDPAAGPGNAPDTLPSSGAASQGVPQTHAPGALVHVPPNEAPETDSPEAAAQRSQQHLERLRQMEQQQESQQPPQP